MTRREQLQEQYEDALFALMMDDVAASEGQKLLEENERLKSDPEADVPEETSRQCLRTIRKHFAKGRAHAAGRFTAKALGRVAMAAGIAAMLFTAAFAASETVRVNTLNLVVEVFGDSTHFSFRNTPITDNNISQVNAGWLPEGYTFEAKGLDNLGSWIHYRKSDNECIQIANTAGSGTVLGVDTENVNTENIIIGNLPATLITKVNELQIVWGTANQGAFIWIIGTGVTRDELIHVANEVEY